MSLDLDLDADFLEVALLDRHQSAPFEIERTSADLDWFPALRAAAGAWRAPSVTSACEQAALQHDAHTLSSL